MARKRRAEGPFFPQDMEAKHASLMQDYHLLQHEFAGLKDRLQAAKMTKATLLAEVRFLRRRLKKLKETPSDKENGMASASPQHQSLRTQNAKNHSQSVMPPPSTNSTKNNPFPVIWKPFSDESVKKNSVRDHNTGLVGVLKSTSLRNRSNAFATSTAEKRKISWQDKISLECN